MAGAGESLIRRHHTFKLNFGVLAGYSAGFHPHGPSMLHKVLAQGLGATMWFFMLYRAR